MTLQAFCRDFCPFIQQGLAELTKMLRRGCPYWWSHCTIYPKYSLGGAVWRSCRLLYLGDVALLKKIKDYLGMMRSSIIVMVMVVIPEMLPGERHYGNSQNAPLELTGEVSVREHKRRFGTMVNCSPDVFRTTTSLGPISLAPLLEALTR